MAKLKEEYEQFLNDIEQNIKNKEDLEYIKNRLETFFKFILEQMDYILTAKEDKIEKIEKNHKELVEKMSKMEQVIQNIEKDIYADDGFDFEIICPYCNYEFIIDVDEDKTEIECPECKNIIELDWTGDLDKEENCSGNCSHCSGCEDEQEDNENEDDDM